MANAETAMVFFSVRLQLAPFTMLYMSPFGTPHYEPRHQGIPDQEFMNARRIRTGSCPGLTIAHPGLFMQMQCCICMNSTPKSCLPGSADLELPANFARKVAGKVAWPFPLEELA